MSLNLYCYFKCRILGEIGSKYVELLPEIVPILIKSLEDETPAVVRQVIACGADLFSSTLEKVAVQVVFFFRFCICDVLYVFGMLIAIWLPLSCFRVCILVSWMNFLNLRGHG